MIQKKFVLLMALLLACFFVGVHALNETPGNQKRRGPPVAHASTSAFPQDDHYSNIGQTPISAASQLSSTDNAAEMASKAFTLARDCAFAKRERQSIDSQLRVCEQNEPYRNDPAQARYFASCDARATAFEKRLNALEAALSHCDSASMDATEVTFYDRTHEAARLGDTDAQLCYVSANFTLPREWTAVEKSAYKQEAQDYLAKAMRRGDWRFAELMRSKTPRAMESNTLFPQISLGDQSTRYRYNRLLRLGASSWRYQQYLDNLMDDDMMSPQEKVSGDEWARRTYDAYFKHSPRMDTNPDTCLTSPDDVNTALLQMPR